MKRLSILIPLIIWLQSSQGQSFDYPYYPVPFSEVKISDAFWSPRIETSRTVTIPFAFQKSRETGRLENFKLAGRINRGELDHGLYCSKFGYDDSDVYKIIEGASYSLSNHYDKDLDLFLDSLIGDIAAAQEKDGYLYTMRTINPDHSWAKERWVNARTHGSHELYNLGHLYEAAVAHFYATGKKTLLQVAVKSAGLLINTFGPGKLTIASGHQEIEIGLAKLYRVTREKKYLDFARYLLDQRGKGKETGGEYTQDHKPAIEQNEAVGHAVRANYMYSAMADVAAMLNDKDYLAAIDRIWENVVNRKIYITGGVGATGKGEAYGKNYELPNLTAYNETCAAIANVFWNHRMFLLHGDAKYIDVLERTLYNGLLSGVSLDGRKFFYPNPLESKGDYSRSEWFDCSCCPSNISRFIPSLGAYIYAIREDSLFVNLFIGSSTRQKIGKTETEVIQKTQYPWDGNLSLLIRPTKKTNFTLCIRIPGWTGNSPLPGDLYRFTDKPAGKVEIKVNGITTSYKVHKGFALINRKWAKGDRVSVDFLMTVRPVIANDLVAEDRDKVCLNRGPLVFCAEGIDNDKWVNNIILPDHLSSETLWEPDSLGGISMLKTQAYKLVNDGYYQPLTKKAATLTAIPYYAWCHREPGTMNLWFYKEDKVFPPLPDPDSSLFTDYIVVSLKKAEGQKNFYTTNGKDPDQNSSLYLSPLRLEETTLLKARAYNDQGTASEIVSRQFTKTTLKKGINPFKLEAGLSYQYFRKKVRTLPDFTKETIEKKGVTDDFDILSIRDTSDFYCVLFSGLIYCPEDGIYNFYCKSDDGSKLVIDGETVVLNDGLHEMEEIRGQIGLEKGFHPMRLEYFEYASDEGLEVAWQYNDSDKSRIHKTYLFH